MTAQLQVATPHRADWQVVGDVLADAFRDDPVLGWLLPASVSRLDVLRRFFAIETRDIVLRHGWSQAGSVGGTTVGVALALPPGHWRSPLLVQAVHGLDYLRVFRLGLPRAFGLLTRLERLHPREPHVYLPYVGVASSAQGQGHGTTLLGPLLARCDDLGLPAYLEASSPRSARLYERLGFVTTRVVRPFGSPPIELMLRRPAQRLR